MQKLIIQIPCLNEEETLPITLADLPREVEGFETVEWMVIDDGSTDRTVAVAKECGVDHIISLPHNQGLAKAFMAGIEHALRLGADVIVNTDADNQYDATCIPDLVRPILAKQALITIGARPIDTIEHFSPMKKFLQKFGSWVVKFASDTQVADAPSGFRAFHRDAAIRLNVFNAYTYTLETIIQAGRKNIPIVSVPIRVNGDLRPSRLVKSIPSYVRRSLITVIRIFIVYCPLRIFATSALIAALPGLIMTLRFLYHYFNGEGSGHIQSLVLSGALFAIAGVLAIGGILADLIATNRQMLEDIKLNQLRDSLERLQTTARADN
ncbi:glycosyltransferase family 2 protein [Phyllobacterium endophyticum]|uniref:Glycosyl transferase n=1 Tax=Phyllobacterium endophyticum TaxID=1149773 RepID=A0A2P7AXB2_9HYPH|nr:glycosyltransferase family 2 protein [Phyllobacterium endophyticum]MBB3235105.1 glycosyltransferase involved in cell wall biosynthesis [Phyllobacterium endophyticum]PSH58833.1 glycosyl transferase [Phyllobacterium endophyticum]TXR48957.1 glycosyltransferase family 2 protein [Phyllobacterium endophyticum]TYR39176.1 glycosyltransferase family 2 protein [Phyllobacterium endophyticum]